MDAAVQLDTAGPFSDRLRSVRYAPVTGHPFVLAIGSNSVAKIFQRFALTCKFFSDWSPLVLASMRDLISHSGTASSETMAHFGKSL